MILKIYLDEPTERRLKIIREEMATPIDDLVARAVAEQALDYFRDRRDDPAQLVEAE